MATVQATTKGPSSRRARPRWRRVVFGAALTLAVVVVASWWAIDRYFFDNPPGPPPLELTPLTDTPSSTAA